MVVKKNVYLNKNEVKKKKKMQKSIWLEAYFRRLNPILFHVT